MDFNTSLGGVKGFASTTLVNMSLVNPLDRLLETEQTIDLRGERIIETCVL